MEMDGPMRIAGEPVSRYGFPFASVAQLVEQVTLNHLVLGSSPSRGMRWVAGQIDAELMFHLFTFIYFRVPKLGVGH